VIKVVIVLHLPKPVASGKTPDLGITRSKIYAIGAQDGSPLGQKAA